MSDRPKVVTLCGSTRFYAEFQRMTKELTMAGEIVLAPGTYSHASLEAHGELITLTDEEKAKLDSLHRWKIAMSDYVYVLNVGGYIGPSTKGEIHHAESLCIPIVYLEAL